MTADLQSVVREFGLELHHGKTNIFANAKGRWQTAGTCLDANGNKIKFLQPASCTKYFKRALPLHEYHYREVKHLITAGWVKLTLCNTELSRRKIAVQAHLKLFEAVVTPAAMHGSACWNVTAEREKTLTVARRRRPRVGRLG